MQHNTLSFETETRIFPRWIGRVLFLITRRIPRVTRTVVFKHRETHSNHRVLSAYRIYVHRVNSGAIRSRVGLKRILSSRSINTDESACIWWTWCQL